MPENGSIGAMAEGNPLLQTAEQELLTPDEMLHFVTDWLGNCPNAPGNTDVVEVLLAHGVTQERIEILTHALARGAWAYRAAGELVLQLLGVRRVRAAIARHGRLYHGLGLLEARRDVKALHQEARTLVQREILKTVGPRPAA